MLINFDVHFGRMRQDRESGASTRGEREEVSDSGPAVSFARHRNMATPGIMKWKMQL
jgi:hypothetical protein